MPTHKIEDLLSEGHQRFTPLQRLLKTSTDQKQWTAELRAVLDPTLKHHVEVTEIRGARAILTCTSAAVATRLRFLLPEIRSDLADLQSFGRVRDFDIKVSAQR